MTSVRDFGARGDGKTDDTEAIHHALQKSPGGLLFPRGDYVISKPLYVSLEASGRLALAGHGGTARLLMRGPGPAIHLAGSHRRTAQPSDFQEIDYSVADGVAVVTLNRPERRNAWGGRMSVEYRWALHHAETDPSARVVVLTGAGADMRRRSRD